MPKSNKPDVNDSNFTEIEATHSTATPSTTNRNDELDLIGLDADGIPILDQVFQNKTPSTSKTTQVEFEQIRKEMILELYTELDSFSKAIAQAAAIQITTDLEVQIQTHLKDIIDAKLADLVKGVLKRPHY